MGETIFRKAARLVRQDRLRIIYANDRRAEINVEGDTYLKTGNPKDLRFVRVYEDGSALCGCPSVLYVKGQKACAHIIAAQKIWQPKEKLEEFERKIKEFETLVLAVYGSDEIALD